MDEKWWHGGPRIDGDWILPPKETGADCLTTQLGPEAGHEAGHDRDRVYVVNERHAAVLYGAVQTGGWVYLVEPAGHLEDDPDFTSNGSGLRSASCGRAQILRREKVSSIEIAQVIKALT